MASRRPNEWHIASPKQADETPYTNRTFCDRPVRRRRVIAASDYDAVFVRGMSGGRGPGPHIGDLVCGLCVHNRARGVRSAAFA